MSEPNPTITLPPPCDLDPATGKVDVKGPSLPPRSKRSSSISGSALGTAAKREFDHCPPLIIHHDSAPDYIASSDDEGTSRLKLRRAIVHYRHSLTLSELSFLKELISSGSETNIQCALGKLKDDTLFSPPSPENKANQRVEKTKEPIIAPIPVLLPQMNEDHMNQTPNGDIQTNSSTKTLLISGSGEDSLVLLERYKNSLQEKDHPQNVLHSQFAYDLHKPIEILGRTASFGSDARGAHIEKRMASTVHGNLWKAHESGISLSAIPSSRQPLTVDRTNRIKRSTSAMSSSTMDLVENGGPMACELLDNIFRKYSPPKHLFVERKVIAELNESSNLRHRSHSRSDSFTSTSSVGSSHVDWPPSNFETIFRLRNQAFQKHARSMSMGMKLNSLDLDSHDSNKDTPSRGKNLPPIHHMRRNSSAKSISSIPSLHRASLIRSHSMACKLYG